MPVIEALDGATVERAGALVAREQAAARRVRPELPAAFEDPDVCTAALQRLCDSGQHGLVVMDNGRAAAVMAISCSRSASSSAMVWLPGTASTARATLKAPDPGPNIAAPTATPTTATAAKTATGKTMPTRRIRPRLRLLLRFPVRCRDKAAPSSGLSSGHAPPDTRCLLNAVPAFRVRARAVTGARRLPTAPDLGAPSGPPRTSTAGAPQCQKDRPNARDFG